MNQTEKPTAVGSSDLLASLSYALMRLLRRGKQQPSALQSCGVTPNTGEKSVPMTQDNQPPHLHNLFEKYEWEELVELYGSEPPLVKDLRQDCVVCSVRMAWDRDGGIRFITYLVKGLRLKESPANVEVTGHPPWAACCSGMFVF